MRIGIIPTKPSRVDFLENAIISVLPQLDTLFVYLNEFQENQIPQYLLKYKKKNLIPIGGTDYGSAARFFMCDCLDDDYYFMFDDDLIYPPNWCNYLCKKIEQYGRKAVITLHGKILRQPVTDFYSNMICYNCRNEVGEDVEVHVGGTGVMAFHSDTLQLKMEDFAEKNLDDCEFSKICQQRGVPIICAAHKNDILKYQNLVPTHDTIWYQVKRNPAPLVAMAKSIEWKLTGILDE